MKPAYTPQTIEAAEQLDRLNAIAISEIKNDNSRRAYKNALKAFFLWYGWGKMITPQCLEAYRSYMIAENYAPPTINIRIAALRKLAQVAYAEKCITKEQYEQAEQIAGVTPQAPIPIRKGLKAEQIQAVIDAPLARNAVRTALKRMKDRAIVALMLTCGVDAEEITNLTLESYKIQKGNYLLVGVKRKEKTRTVVLTTRAIGPLKDWLNTLPDRYKLESTNPLFPPTLNNKITEGKTSVFTVKATLLRYCHQTGVPSSARMLKATFAMRTQEQIKALQQAQDLQGR